MMILRISDQLFADKMCPVMRVERNAKYDMERTNKY